MDEELEKLIAAMKADPTVDSEPNDIARVIKEYEANQSQNTQVNTNVQEVVPGDVTTPAVEVTPPVVDPTSDQHANTLDIRQWNQSQIQQAYTIPGSERVGDMPMNAEGSLVSKLNNFHANDGFSFKTDLMGSDAVHMQFHDPDGNLVREQTVLLAGDSHQTSNALATSVMGYSDYLDFISIGEGDEAATAADKEATERADANAKTFMLSSQRDRDEYEKELRNTAVVRAEGEGGDAFYTEEEIKAEMAEEFDNKPGYKRIEETPIEFYKRIEPVESTQEFFRNVGGDMIPYEEPVLTIDGISRRLTNGVRGTASFYKYFKYDKDGKTMLEATQEDRDLFYSHKFHHEQAEAADRMTANLLGDFEGLSVAELNIKGGSAVAGEGAIFSGGQDKALLEQRALLGENILNSKSPASKAIIAAREGGDDTEANRLLEKEIDLQLDLNTSSQDDAAAWIESQQVAVEEGLRDKYNEFLADGTLDSWALTKRFRGQEGDIMSFEEFKTLPQNTDLFAKVYNESQKKFYVENNREFDNEISLLLDEDADGNQSTFVTEASNEAQAIHKDEYDATFKDVQARVLEKFKGRYDRITNQIQKVERKKLANEIRNGTFSGTQEERDAELRKRVLAAYDASDEIKELSAKHQNQQTRAMQDMDGKVNSTFQDIVAKKVTSIQEEYAEKALQNHNKANAEFIDLWQGKGALLIPEEKYAEIFENLNNQGFGIFNTKNKRAAILLEWQAQEAAFLSSGVDKAGIAQRKKEYFYSMWKQLAYDADGNNTVFNNRSSVIDMMDDIKAEAKARQASGEGLGRDGVLGEFRDDLLQKLNRGWRDYLLPGQAELLEEGQDTLDAVENMNESGVVNFFMGMGSTNFIDWVPIVSDVLDLGDSVYMKSLVEKEVAHQKRPRKNPALTQTETNLLLMSKYKEMSTANAASLSNAYSAGVGMPSSAKLMGEMALMYATAGSASLFTRGVLVTAKRKFIKSGLTFAARRTALTPSKFTTKALDVLTQSFVTSLAGTPRVISESYKGMTPEMEFAYSSEFDGLVQSLHARVAENGNDSWSAMLAREFGKNWVENFTEKFGAHLPGMKNSLVGKLTPKEWEDISLRMMMGRYLRKKGFKPGSNTTMKKLKEMVAFDGIWAEVIEEFIAQPPQNLIDGNDLFSGMDQDFVEQTLIATGAMTIAFGSLGISANVINKMSGGQNAYYWVDGTSYATAAQAQEAIQELKDTGKLTADTQIEISYDADALAVANATVKGTVMENRIHNTDVGLEVVDMAQAVEIEANNTLSLEERTIIAENKKRLEEIAIEEQNNAEREQELNEANLPIAETKAEKQKLRETLIATQAEASQLQSENNALLSPIIQRLTKAKTESGYKRLVKKIQKFAEKMDPNLSIIEVKTQEELGLYVSISEKNKALKTHGIRVSVNKKGKETYTDTKTGKTLTKAELLKREIDINKIDADGDAYLKSQGDLGDVHGTILDLNDGTSVIVLNKTVSIELGAKNVAAHEWLHRVLNKTFKNNPQTALAVGRSLDKYIRNMNPSAIANSKLRARITKYQRDQGGIVSAEETLNIFSDAMANGEIVFNENMLTKVGDVIRRSFRAMGVKVSFNEAQDVFNFVRDYNRTMDNTSKTDRMPLGLRRTMNEGANIGGTIKYESDAYNTLLEETGLRTQANKSITKSSDVAKLVDKYDGNHKKMLRKAAAQTPDGRSVFDIDVKPDKHGNTPVLIESEFGQEIMPIVETTTKRLFDGIPTNIADEAGVSRRSFQNDLIAEASAIVQNEYDPSKQAIDKFISNRLNLRANSLAQKLGIASAEEGGKVRLDQQVEGAQKLDIAADDTSMEAFDEQDMSIQGRGKDTQVEQTRKYVDTINLDSKSRDEITTAVSDAAVDVNGLAYKDVKKLTTGVNAPLSKILDVTAAQFGVDPKRIIKPADLNGKQRTSAQQYIKDNTQALIDMLPEGETRSGVATGVANTKLGKFYVKGERGSYAGGATAAGKPTQTKRSDITQQEFREAFGIKADGTFDSNKKNDGAIKALVNQAAVITANQAIRENAIENGSHADAAIALLGDGRSQAMFSKDVKPENQDVYNENYPALIKEVGNANVRDLESIQLATQRVFGGKGLSVAEINKIAKSIYNQVIEYDRIKSEHETGVGARRVEMESTLEEFLENNFKSEQLESSLISVLDKLGLPKDANGKTISVGAHFLDIDRINSRREDVVLLGSRMVAAGMSINEVAQTLVAIYGGMAKDAGKIADGRFIVVDGIVQLDPKWEDHKIDGKLVPGRKWKRESKGPNKGKLKKNANGGRVVQDNRRQAFASTADFIAQLQKIKGLESLSNPSQGVYKLNGGLLETRLIPESSEAFVNEKGSKFEGRKIQATRARGVVEMLLDMTFEKIDSDTGGYDYADLAMILTSLGGQMTSPMRRSAYAEYTMVGVEDVIANAKKNGVSVGSVTEYEHSIPQAEMTLRVLNSYLKNGKLDPKVWEDYKVAVISKAMDTVLIENGYRKRSPIDGKPRYYNTKTFGNPNIKPLRSHDPAKKGTPQEFVGRGFVEAGRIMGETGKASHQDMVALSNAYRGIRLSKSVPKGITVLDFDDTLATTKSGIRYTLPNPSGKPASKKKVIFLAGGPGAGKSNVIKQLGLEAQGFKIVNQDISLEWLAKNHGLPTDMNDFTSEQASTWSSLQWKAMEIAQRKKMKFQGNGDGVVVDGTGQNSTSMNAQMNEFQRKGYDVQMIFVETSKEVALKRNKERKERSLKDSVVERTHDSVMKNKRAFKQFFGDNFAEINTDNLKQGDSMPKDLIDKLDRFTKGYIKGRLSASEFASEGSKLKEQGAEFDFFEFNTVREGKTAPLFNKALKLAGKFGAKDMFILTARNAAAAPAIKQFLDSQGLNIPIENIVGLGKSEASAKAEWVASKIGEGYNDFYFADDAIQNVDAVKETLKKAGVKGKVQQAKADFDKSDALTADGTYGSIMFSKSHRAEYEGILSKNRPDLVRDGLVSKTVDGMFAFIDSLDVAADKKRKYEKVTTKWLATSNIKLVEDRFKITDAIDIAERFKLDIFSYNNPNEIIEAYAGKTTKKPLDPNKVTEFGPGVVTNEEYNITEHVVDDTKEGQKAVRDILDSHWGEKSNPWCITQKKHGRLTENSWDQWQGYSDKPKSIVFQDGKLLAFKANGLHWDRMDNNTKHPIVNVKEGRVTTKFELGKKRRAIERVTVSEDGKTTTTEYLVETNTRTDGEKTVEERNNGRKIKVTEFSSRGVINKLTTFDTNGNVTGIRGYDSLGWMSALNNIGLHRLDIPVAEFLGKEGDIATREYYDSDTRKYTFSGMVLHEGGARNISWKALDGAIGADLKNVTSEVDGKTRLDFNKILELDPNAKGIPGTVDAKTGFRFSREGPSKITDIQNISAVKDMLDRFDVKGKVQQAKLRFSREGPSKITDILNGGARDLDSDFNIVLEESKNVGRQKRFSPAKARQRGKNKGKFKFFIPPSADDFAGLCYSFLGKGKQGDQHHAWFKKHLFDPFSKGTRSINGMKNLVAAEVKALRKGTPGIKSLLKKKAPGTEFTNEQAARVYNWNKANYVVPGLSDADLAKMVSAVENNETLKDFADGLSTILEQTEGVAEPGVEWLGGVINSDVNDALEAARSSHLVQWKDNKNVVFSEESMNKIEAVYGSNFREALEDILYRMETGSTQNIGKDRLLNNFTAWIHGSIGTTMFFNARSAILQLTSWVNFINWSDNNPLAAAKAFANQKQYWKDVAMIFNSAYLKQRRSGLKTDLNAAELLNSVKDSKNPMKAVVAYLLRIGFTPTQAADSAAIAIGGSTYYRNKVNSYLKAGMTQTEAETKAFEEFMEVAEETQQSARPDRISQQQASPIGKFILAFQNTPMQMNRLMKKAAQDLVNNRGDSKSNVSKIIYYGGIQSIIFYGLQTLIFESLLGDDDDEDAKLEKKKAYMINGMIDSVLRGSGIGGAVVATVKNVVLEFLEQEEKEKDDEWMTQANHAYTLLETLNVSPPIGIKARKLYGAATTWDYNREIIKHMDKTDIDNPIHDVTGAVAESIFNIPLSRLYSKTQNVREAMDSDNETWKRVAMFLGWNRWTLGAENQAVLDAKGEVREIKDKNKEIKAKEKKAIIDAENLAADALVIEENIKDQKEERKAVEDADTEEKKEEAKENVACAAVNRSGKRCGSKPVGNGTYCTVHEKVEAREDGKKVQCSHIKEDGKKCKMKTTNKSGKCYYHD